MAATGKLHNLGAASVLTQNLFQMRGGVVQSVGKIEKHIGLSIHVHQVDFVEFVKQCDEYHRASGI